MFINVFKICYLLLYSVSTYDFKFDFVSYNLQFITTLFQPSDTKLA